MKKLMFIIALPFLLALFLAVAGCDYCPRYKVLEFKYDAKFNKEDASKVDLTIKAYTEEVCTSGTFPYYSEYDCDVVKYSIVLNGVDKEDIEFYKRFYTKLYTSRWVEAYEKEYTECKRLAELKREVE